MTRRGQSSADQPWDGMAAKSKPNDQASFLIKNGPSRVGVSGPRGTLEQRIALSWGWVVLLCVVGQKRLSVAPPSPRISALRSPFGQILYP